MLESISQWDINHHLVEVGSNPTEAVWGSVQDLLPLMKRFLERGGRYEDPGTYSALPKKIHRSSTKYPTPAMWVYYKSDYLLLTKELVHGYPTIKLWIKETDPCMHQGKNKWNKCLVHPEHLDTALLHIFEMSNVQEGDHK